MTTRRDLLLLSAAATGTAAAAGATHAGMTEHDLADLIQRDADAASALIRGDVHRYLALISHADDYTLMAPFGGTPTRGFDASGERLAELSRFFKSGTAAVEVIQTYTSGDLVVLATIERHRAEVGGLPEQDWSLRVTQVFRRHAAGWHRAHRHADPLVGRIGVEKAAALARG